MPDIMLRILNEGGLVPYIKKYKDFTVKPSSGLGNVF